MSKTIKSTDEAHNLNDDLHSITNVKEIDAQALQSFYLDQFKNLSLSFYNEIPLHSSQTSTNFTNKSNNSNIEKPSKINKLENSKNLMGKIFKNTEKKQEIKAKERVSLNKPKNPVNFRTFFLNNRFFLNKTSTKISENSVSKSKLISNYSQIVQKKTKSPKQEIKKHCINNVKISLNCQKFKGLNTSFNERSASRGGDKKNEVKIGNLKGNNASFLERSVSKTKNNKKNDLIESQFNKKKELNNSFTGNLKIFKAFSKKILNKKEENNMKTPKKIEEKSLGLWKK